MLGDGGMRVVVAGTYLGLEQRVAIKFLTREAMRNKEAVERFQREAKVAARVKSEHVARVHDIGTVEDGGPYIVMEYLEGSDLGLLIAAGASLPYPTLARSRCRRARPSWRFTRPVSFIAISSPRISL